MASRGYNAQDLLERIPSAGGPVRGFAMTAGTAQAHDWPSDAQIVRLCGLSSVGAQLGFYFNDGSTLAAVGAATTLTTGSTGLNIAVFGERIFKRCADTTALSTGFSLIAPSSGFITAEFFAAR